MPCLTGHPALCENGAASNAAGTLLNGEKRLLSINHDELHHHMGVSAFAEYAVVSKQSLVKIPRTLPFEIAALFGCAVITGVGAVVNTAGMRPGQHILITGLGGVGLAALLGAIAAGAGKVIACDLNPEKRKMAEQLGASLVIDPAEGHALEKLRDFTSGGVDISAEFAGAIPALEFAYQATRRGGKTVTAGLPHPDKKISISPTRLVGDEKSFMGSYLGSCIPSRDIPAYIELYQRGRLPVDKLLTHRISLSQVNEGFERLAAGEAVRQVMIFD
jgi:alcohol dehydrogenase